MSTARSSFFAPSLALLLASATDCCAQEGSDLPHPDSVIVWLYLHESDVLGDSLELRGLWQQAFGREFLRAQKYEQMFNEQVGITGGWVKKYDQSQDDLVHCEMGLTNCRVTLSEEQSKPKGKGRVGMFVLGFGLGGLLTWGIVEASEVDFH